MEKIVRIGDTEVRLRASALLPRLYRYKYGRDLIHDMRELEKNFRRAIKAKNAETEEEQEDAQLGVLDLTIFENVAHLMARQADKSIPEDADEWLDTIPGAFSIYEILPEILDLWAFNQAQTSAPLKK